MGIDRDVIRDSNQNQTDEESGKHCNGPESPAACLHEENSRNGSDQQRSTSNKRHVCSLLVVEANLVHQDRHVVHDGIYTSQLSEKNHDVCINKSSAGARNTTILVSKDRQDKGYFILVEHHHLREKVHPREA